MSESKPKFKVKKEQLDEDDDDDLILKHRKSFSSSGTVKREKDSETPKLKKDNVAGKVKPVTDAKAVKMKTESPSLKAVKTEAVLVKKESVKKEADSGSKRKDNPEIRTVKKEKEEMVVSTKSVKVKGKDEGEKKEKKVYSLPGQKHDPPEERDPLRIFYESLYQQNPESEMAEVWMMEHGLLPLDIAKKAYERKQKRQKMAGTPIKLSKESIVKSEKKRSINGESKASVKSKIKHEDFDDDDDFILKPKKKLKMNA